MTLFDLVANREYQNKHVLTKLIEHYTGVPYKQIVMHYDDVIADDVAKQIISDYRSYNTDKKPLEYIVWQVEFLGRTFAIDHRAMIPRPETEYMIEGVVEELKGWKAERLKGGKTLCVLDLGCGCGVLGLSVVSELSKEYDNLNLQSRDISADAVALTQQNIQTYQALLPQVPMATCVSEWLKELTKQAALLQQWQDNDLVIVCNYPYIPDETFDINADECAKTREPRSAFVGGVDGLDLYRVLFGEIEQYKLTHAVLFLEMMTWQMDKLIQEFGDHVDLQIIKTFHFNIIIVKAQWKN